VEIFVERLLIELVAIGVQLAIMRLIAWLQERSSAEATDRSFAQAA
jgi:hypothetical protein